MDLSLVNDLPPPSRITRSQNTPEKAVEAMISNGSIRTHSELNNLISGFAVISQSELTNFFNTIKMYWVDDMPSNERLREMVEADNMEDVQYKTVPPFPMDRQVTDNGIIVYNCAKNAWNSYENKDASGFARMPIYGRAVYKKPRHGQGMVLHPPGTTQLKF